jgi:anti-sigma factor ChrR (cupin superfamily)
MSDTARKSDHIATVEDPAAFAHWPEGVYEDMQRNAFSGCVGSVLVSETDRVRVWRLHIAPGARCAFHRHVNPYFWSSHANGKARGYLANGVIRDTTH